MAEPKKVSITLTNTADGPRSFFDADRQNHILRKGESWSGDILAADKADLSADLAQGDKAAADSGSGQSAEEAQRIQEAAELLVKTNNRDQLVALAEKEGVTGLDKDASKNTIALAIAQKRAANPAS